MKASEKQINYIRRLLDERVIHEVHGTRAIGLVLAHEEGREEMSMAKASQIIDYLQQHPYREGVTPPTTAVQSDLDISALQAGRYAVGDVLFKLDKPEAGRWDGWTFVRNGSEYVDEKFGSQRPGGKYRGQHDDLLAQVVEDPIAAMKHYGAITGSCAVCGRKLEDEVSVARGIGPVCWERVA